MTIEDFLAAESYFEPAACSLLRTKGFNVASPFVQVTGSNANGDPILAPTPDDACTVIFHLGESDPEIRAFITTSRGTSHAMNAGFEGILEITHHVPVNSPGSSPADVPGEAPGCYRRLLRQRGAIRALFLEHEDPFETFLPQIDILSITLVAPERGVARERAVNHATERFRIRFMPAAGAFG